MVADSMHVKYVFVTCSEFSTEVKLSGSADENALLLLQTLASKVSFDVFPRFKLKKIFNKQEAPRSNEFFSVLFCKPTFYNLADPLRWKIVIKKIKPK